MNEYEEECCCGEVMHLAEIRSETPYGSFLSNHLECSMCGNAVVTDEQKIYHLSRIIELAGNSYQKLQSDLEQERERRESAEDTLRYENNLEAIIAHFAKYAKGEGDE